MPGQLFHGFAHIDRKNLLWAVIELLLIIPVLRTQLGAIEMIALFFSASLLVSNILCLEAYFRNPGARLLPETREDVLASAASVQGQPVSQRYETAKAELLDQRPWYRMQIRMAALEKNFRSSKEGCSPNEGDVGLQFGRDLEDLEGQIAACRKKADDECRRFENIENLKIYGRANVGSFPARSSLGENNARSFQCRAAANTVSVMLSIFMLPQPMLPFMILFPHFLVAILFARYPIQCQLSQPHCGPL